MAIHVKLIEYTPNEAEFYLEKARSFLDEDERQRARSILKKEKATSFILRRALRRLILSDVLNLQPKQLQFIDENWAKPKIKNQNLMFNCSSSENFILIAYATDLVNIGVDIEVVRELPDLKDLIRAHMPELWGIEDSTTILRLFYEQWSKKEAFLKCLGSGLSIEPSTLRLPVGSVTYFKHNENSYHFLSLSDLPQVSAYISYSENRSEIEIEKLALHTYFNSSL